MTDEETVDQWALCAEIEYLALKLAGAVEDADERIASLTTRLEQAEGALREIAAIRINDRRREIALAAIPTGEPSKQVMDLNGDPISDNPPWGATGGYGRVATGEPSKGERCPHPEMSRECLAFHRGTGESGWEHHRHTKDKTR